MISLGRGQGPKAEELIAKAQILKGRWVFLQNCHLAASWMPKLQTLVEKWVSYLFFNYWYGFISFIWFYDVILIELFMHLQINSDQVSVYFLLDIFSFSISPVKQSNCNRWLFAIWVFPSLFNNFCIMWRVIVYHTVANIVSDVSF